MSRTCGDHLAPIASLTPLRSDVVAGVYSLDIPTLLDSLSDYLQKRGMIDSHVNTFIRAPLSHQGSCRTDRPSMNGSRTDPTHEQETGRLRWRSLPFSVDGRLDVFRPFRPPFFN